MRWIFVGALGVSAFFYIFKNYFGGYPTREGPGYGLGHEFGRVMFFVLVSAIVIVPWRIIQKRFGSVTNTPIGVAVMIMLVFIYAFYISEIDTLF